MTKVKICGITRFEDAELCVRLGVDFLGFIFVRESPRYVKPEVAKRVVESTSRRVVEFVGVFRDEEPETVRALAERVGLDFVQIYGPEIAGVPSIRAFHVGDELPDTTTSAEWVLFDSGGGTGRTFDWSLLAAYPRTKPFFLAGGITPENVGDAIRIVRPDAIDVASGVESKPGVKDHEKVRRLIERVRG